VSWRILGACLLAAFLIVPGAARADDGATITNYPRSYFDPIRPQTALDMVNWLPGFAFSKGDADVRGFAGAAGNVLIDGVRPADKQFTLDQVLARIPADAVERIEVIRGSAPGYEMLGQTVVANVIRKKARPSSVTLTAVDKWYSNGPHAPSVTLDFGRDLEGGRHLQAAVSASRYVDVAQGDGPRTRTDAAGNVIKTAFDNTSGGGTTAFGYAVLETPLAPGKLRLNANLSWTDYFRDEHDRTSNFVVSTLHEHLGGVLGGQGNVELGAQFSGDLGAGLTNESLSTLRLRRQTYGSTLSSPGAVSAFAERDAKGETILRTDFRKTFSSRWSGEVSLEGDYNWLNTRSAFSYDAVPIPLPDAGATVTETRGEALAQLTWTACADVRLEAGLRTEISVIASKSDTSQRKTLFYPKPRIAATFTPFDGAQIRLRLEREVGQLDFANFVASSALSTGRVEAGNTNIVPQQDWVYEVAYEQHFRSFGTWDFTFRHSEISDAIDRVPVYGAGSVFDAPGNIGGGRQDMAIADATLPLDFLGIPHAQVKSAATLRWSEVRDPTTGRMRRLTEDEPMELEVDFRQDIAAWRAAWGATFTGNTTKSDFRFDEIDTYGTTATLDLFAEYQPADGTTLRLEVDNIASNRSKRLLAVYPGPRSTDALDYADDRSLRFGPAVLVSVRGAL